MSNATAVVLFRDEEIVLQIRTPKCSYCSGYLGVLDCEMRINERKIMFTKRIKITNISECLVVELKYKQNLCFLIIYYRIQREKRVECTV